MCRPKVLLVDEFSIGRAPAVVDQFMPTLERLRDESHTPSSLWSKRLKELST
jgi:ABC-type branched-subunit amino acid transport system ATPase component